jgi:hypothetical protein
MKYAERAKEWKAGGEGEDERQGRGYGERMSH